MANDNKSGEKISMGYGIADYDKLINEYLQKDKTKVIIRQEGTSENPTGVMTGGYIPATNELVANNIDASSIMVNERGYSIGKDEDKKMAVLSFVPRRGYIATDKTERKTYVITMNSVMDNRVISGHCVCGDYVSPPTSLNKEIIEKAKSNTESGDYRVGCAIDAEGMLKGYMEHFYVNEPIGKGLSSGTISKEKLKRLIAERCLYAEVAFGDANKSAFMAVTDSVKIGSGESELYIHIDAPLCSTSAFSSVFQSNLPSTMESVNFSSEYDFKKGKLKECNPKSYEDYAERFSNETREYPISLIKNHKLGVRFFSLSEKKQQVENILGEMPEEFFKSNTNPSLDMSKTVVFSGVEFVSGDIMEARKTFCEKRGPVPEEALNKIRYLARKHDENLKNPLYFKELINSGKGNKLGVDCSYFLIPAGYPMGFGHRPLSHNIVYELTTRKRSAFVNNPLLSAGGSTPKALHRGLTDDVYQKIYEDACTGVIAIRCNIFIGEMMSLIFETIKAYYGGINLAKIIPSACTMTSGPRTVEAGWAHRCGKAFDFDHNNNIGRVSTIQAGQHTNYKAFLEIMKAGGIRKWPITTNSGVLDQMHFQFGSWKIGAFKNK